MKVAFSIKIKDNFRIKGQRHNWDKKNMKDRAFNDII